eukprot:6206111-Pleurochrysis_carterae.AAC.3
MTYECAAPPPSTPDSAARSLRVRWRRARLKVESVSPRVRAVACAHLERARRWLLVVAFVADHACRAKDAERDVLTHRVDVAPALLVRVARHARRATHCDRGATALDHCRVQHIGAAPLGGAHHRVGARRLERADFQHPCKQVRQLAPAKAVPGHAARWLRPALVDRVIEEP